MIIINTTPQKVTDANSGIVFPSDPSRVATVEAEYTPLFGLNNDGSNDHMFVCSRTFKQVQNEPQQKEGVMYIVTIPVQQALPHRTDFLLAGPPIRDDKGIIIKNDGFIKGCTSTPVMSVSTTRPITFGFNITGTFESIINTTPHEIKEYETGKRFPPDLAHEIRVIEVLEPFTTITVDGSEIMIYERTLGALHNEPVQKHGVYYLVSMLVQQAAPHRSDFLCVGELVRGPNRSILGCKGFVGQK